MDDQLNRMKQEYQEFLLSSGQPPRAVRDRVLNQIRLALNPGPWSVFAKLAMIHFFSAVATLSICPQFGVRTFGDGMGLMHTFMAFGEHGCMVVCGGLFIGTTLALCGVLLRPEEVRVLRRYELLQVTAVAFLSLGALAMLDSSIVLGFAFSWLLGGILAGAASLELTWTFRQRLLARS